MIIGPPKPALPRGGALRDLLRDAGDEARREGQHIRRRMIQVSQKGKFGFDPDNETPAPVLAWFAEKMVLVAFKLLHGAYCAAHAAFGENDDVRALGRIVAALMAFIASQRGDA